ncbi:MAG: sulfatase [Deltaproteobacteria bacterium]|nr:sulfatase [Deltaproteobacteria bacterium]
MQLVLKRLLDRRWPWIVTVAVTLVAFLSIYVEVRLPGDWDRRPSGSNADIAGLRDRTDLNVLFILIDTLRAERLGSYGYERDTSPVLDQLAHSGVRFDRHLSQSSWTKASMASLWTGLYPARTGVTRFDDVVPDAAQMPAEFLREAGFQTVGLYRNGWVAPTFGFDQGFDVYQRPLTNPLPPNVRRENPTLGEKGTDQGVIETAAEFVRINGRKRWFLYLHLMDLHEYIYDAESALFGSTYSDNYDNSIRWTDGWIETLLESLADLDALENTLIVIASDHGEAFLERGFEGHARRVYRESTEIPFLLVFPFRLDPGVVVEARTRNVDVWPTVLDLLGIEPPEGIDGRSLVPDILAGAAGRVPDGGGRTAISDLDQTWGQRSMDALPTIAVVEDNLRYVRVEQQGGGHTEELFDATDDPLELRDRAADETATLERMRAVADAYYDTEPSWGETPTREIGELELNLLRALGYQVE